jgi:hypothetical protein
MLDPDPAQDPYQMNTDPKHIEIIRQFLLYKLLKDNYVRHIFIILLHVQGSPKRWHRLQVQGHQQAMRVVFSSSSSFSMLLYHSSLFASCTKLPKPLYVFSEVVWESEHYGGGAGGQTQGIPIAINIAINSLFSFVCMPTGGTLLELMFYSLSVLEALAVTVLW